jgi:hypothetical protein
MYVLERDRRHVRVLGRSRPPRPASVHLAHMAAAAAFLIVLVEVAVIAAVLYLVIRFGVRDGMSDFENRRARRGP